MKNQPIIVPDFVFGTFIDVVNAVSYAAASYFVSNLIIKWYCGLAGD